MPNLPKNFGRAVDLSSLGKPRAPKSAQSNFSEATAENFIPELVAKSKEIPVVVLAYSDRSPASIEIRDLLAKLSHADGGSWKFGAIDVDNQPELAQALRLQTIPSAFAFIAEQAVPLPDLPPREDQIRGLLSQIFKIAQERGLKVDIPETPEPKMEPEEIAALSAMESGDYSGAAMAYRNWLQRDPNEPLAKIGLAQCELMVRISALDPALTLKNADARPDSLSDQMMAADIEIAQGKSKNAFDRLLNCVTKMRGEDREKAKAHLLTLFQLVDPRDPDLVKARQLLASALF
jgi:putative thioredoxin